MEKDVTWPWPRLAGTESEMLGLDGTKQGWSSQQRPLHSNYVTQVRYNLKEIPIFEAHLGYKHLLSLLVG